MADTHPPEQTNSPAVDFEQVFQHEKQKLGITDTAKATGLALSGGGIRSASFGLGVIQALLEHGVMQKIDYLSTVSGGGYIGTALTWNRHLHGDPKTFFKPPSPFGEKGQGVRSDLADLECADTDEACKEMTGDDIFLSYIRQHSSYLNPSKLMNLQSAIGLALRNLVISFMIYFSFLLIVISLWTIATSFTARAIPDKIHQNQVLPILQKIEASFKRPAETGASTADIIPADENVANGGKWVHHAFFYINLFIAAAIFIASIIYGLWFSLSTYRAPLRDDKQGISSYYNRSLFQVISGILLIGFIVFVILALVPLIDDRFNNWMGRVGTIGIISGVWAAWSKFRKFLGAESVFKKASWIGDRLFEIGAFIFLFAMVVFSYNLALKIGVPATKDAALTAPPLYILGGIMLGAIVFARLVNINYASLGRMYRDRLMEAFLPATDSIVDNTWGPSKDADAALLEHMCRENDDSIRRPYHLINANVILTSSKKEKYRRRGGDSFVLSPLYCGSNATMYVPTKRFVKNRDQTKGGLTLATAMAISGAAANPHTGVAGKGPTRGPLVSMLMTIFNLRLGAWVSNPKDGGPYRRVNYIRPGLCSLLCYGYDENWRFLELTDGGHFENLGVYELVRRRVGTIIVSDAGVDKDFKFGDLSNAIEKVRTDFGVSIRFSPEQVELNKLKPGSAQNGDEAEHYNLAETGYIEGRIKYPKTEDSKGFDGRIFLIKTTMIKDLPADLYSYKARHNSFPDQPTSDQFFDEEQFEAYRELGYRIADAMCKRCPWV